MDLELTQSTASDLREISRYTSKVWGEVQEERYLKGIYLKFHEIAYDPARWRFRNDLFPRCQIAKYSRHVILFLCDEDRLVIVRVLHAAMDFKSHISEE